MHRLTTRRAHALATFVLLVALPSSFARADDDLRIARWHARAEALVARGRGAQAGALFLRILDRAPANRRALVGLADVVLPDLGAAMRAPGPDLRRLALLIERLERARASDPAAEDRATIERLRAWAIAWRDGPRAGLDAMLPGLSPHDPEGAAWLAKIAALAILRADLDTAALALTAAIHADGTNERWRSDAALVALARGRVEDATDSLRLRSAQEAPVGDPTTIVGTLLAAGESDEALRRAYAHAASVDDGEHWTWLAAVALEAGNPSLAEGAAHRASALVPPSDSRAFRLRGLALVALRRIDDARVALLEALRRSPGDVAARAALEALGR